MKFDDIQQLLIVRNNVKNMPELGVVIIHTIIKHQLKRKNMINICL